MNNSESNLMEVVPAEVQIIKAKQDAEFAMTTAGQMLRSFEATQRIAKMYATSSLIPASLKGDPNKEFGTPEQKVQAAMQKTYANCTIALNMAQRMNADPLMVMQNLYIVHGQPSFSSKFLIACINKCGRYAPLRYEFKGEQGTDDYGCRAYTYETSDVKHKEPIYGTWVTMGMAKKEGWTTKNGSKWLTMPDQMLIYRAAAFFQRSNCPEISMGLSTSEELQDMGEQPVYVEEVKDNDLSSLAMKRMKRPAAIAQAEAGTAGIRLHKDQAAIAQAEATTVDGRKDPAEAEEAEGAPAPQGNPFEQAEEVNEQAAEVNEQAAAKEQSEATQQNAANQNNRPSLL